MTMKKSVWAGHSQFQWQGKTSLSQFLEELVCLCHAQQPFQQPVTTRLSKFQQPERTSFELVTTSFNHKEKWFELVTASFNNQEEPVWASHSQFKWQEKNQFELVTASLNNQEEPLWVSHSQFQWQWKTSLSWSQPISMTRKTSFDPVSTTRKNQFELVTASFNNQSQPDWVSFNNQEEPVLS